MPLDFNKIPSETAVDHVPPQDPTVGQEIACVQHLLQKRITKCKPIKPLFQHYKRQLNYTYRWCCICPRFNPRLLCKHTGNIIIDRDILTQEEHICFLAVPKENKAAPRKPLRYIPKKSIVPTCTSRIARLAMPKIRSVADNLEQFEAFISKRHFKSLKKYQIQKPDVESTDLNTSLEYIEEELRLKRVAKMMEKRRCKRLKRIIVRNQRKQIKKIICILFEEMKPFFLNDQFLISEDSPLCSVIFEQIGKFTEKEFYTTNNLRNYQQVLANNVSVWINKFISNLNIHVASPPPKVEPAEPEEYLPLQDYISCSDELGEEEFNTDESDIQFDEGDDMPLDEDEEVSENTENTIINVNP